MLPRILPQQVRRLFPQPRPQGTIVGDSGPDGQPRAVGPRPLILGVPFAVRTANAARWPGRATSATAVSPP